MQVYAYNAEADAYQLHTQHLSTLENARRIRGSVAKLRGGASLHVESLLFQGDLDFKSETEARNFDLVSGDHPVWAQYAYRDKVITPSDWESLMMFSFYHHVEEGISYYRVLGVPEEALGQLVSHFQVQFSSAFVGGLPLVGKNAAYTPIDDTFLLFPSFTDNNRIPLIVNEGVVVHELAHAIKHRILHGENRLPIPMRDDWPDAALNAYNSEDEGFADFFATVYSKNNDFISLSIKDEELDRNIALARPFSQELYDAMQEDALSYDPYPLGSAFASWLYAIGQGDEDKLLSIAQICIETLANIEASLNADYSLHVLMQALIARLPEELATEACTLLENRLEDDFRQGAPCAIE